MSAPIALSATPPKPVDVEAIERELAQLWHDPDHDPEKPEAVTRACMSNLIVFCASRAEAEPMSQEIGAIVAQHPARVLLLIGAVDGEGNDIAAQVSAHSHVIGGSRRQVFSEHVTVTASGAATQRLPSVARSLLIGDLPTALWWATPAPPPSGGPLFEELSVMTGQVIYDSLGWTNPLRDLVATANWAGNASRMQLIADLSWRRLKSWRRIISQALDPLVVPGALSGITEVAMEHGPHGLPQAWLLVSWLARRLGWQPTKGTIKPGTEIVWNFAAPRHPVKVMIDRQPHGPPVVSKISISWPDGPKRATAHFELASQGRLMVTWDDPSIPPRTLAAPEQTRASLIARQLPDLGDDTLFRNTLQVCKHMAEALP